MKTHPSIEGVKQWWFMVLQAVVGPDGEDGELHSSDEPDEGEGSYPRTDSTYSIDIPNSSTLWEVDPRPNNSSQVMNATAGENKGSKN